MSVQISGHVIRHNGATLHYLAVSVAKNAFVHSFSMLPRFTAGIMPTVKQIKQLVKTGSF
jgi:hypothetical protein